MQITDLPPELIASFPDYLHSPDDLYSLISTYRFFYSNCANTSARVLPKFAKKYEQNLLPSHPHLLLSGTIRQGADWAVESEENRRQLHDAISPGSEGRLDLAIKVTRLGLKDVRAIYKAKYDIVNLLSRKLDLECGQGERNRDPGTWPICENIKQAL